MSEMLRIRLSKSVLKIDLAQNNFTPPLNVVEVVALAHTTSEKNAWL